MEESTNVHYIPKNALIPVEIGAGFLQRLQKMLVFTIEGKTDEEIELLKESLVNNTVQEDSWMYHYQTLQTFIMIVEQTAVEKNLTILKPLESPEAE